MGEKVIEMLEEILEVDEGTLTMNTKLEEIEEWDSIAKMILMAEAKKNGSKELTVEEIKKFRFVKDICDFFME